MQMQFHKLFFWNIFQYSLSLSLFFLNPVPIFPKYELMDLKTENTNLFIHVNKF
jgi:hypothetical protein